jgi:hypothetical protein
MEGGFLITAPSLPGRGLSTEAPSTTGREEAMSTAVETDRIAQEIALLDEDPAAYAGKLGLPVDMNELIDPEALDSESSITIVIVLT